ncbi:hypothetical protein [Methylomonas rapida]|uniref:Antitoxin n=1 Tax=Methylomonas rapida TaxID=2963939 RepID=A0ABY7GQ17_9GAMM|nr:hypothetical protein [Methylomonas rapida]WAR46595.1 hypothetical protein NM686_008795 [Methylomonas rapida]
MRTTVDLEDDVLAAAKELARMQNVAVGRVISRLMREALSGQSSLSGTTVESRTVGGFRPFSSRGIVVTNDRVNELRDREGV